jgi:hypothetical protein
MIWSKFKNHVPLYCFKPPDPKPAPIEHERNAAIVSSPSKWKLNKRSERSKIKLNSGSSFLSHFKPIVLQLPTMVKLRSLTLGCICSPTSTLQRSTRKISIILVWITNVTCSQVTDISSCWRLRRLIHWTFSVLPYYLLVGLRLLPSCHQEECHCMDEGHEST